MTQGSRLRGGAVLLALTAVLACRTGGQAPPPVTHTVTIESMRFSPAALTVRPGDTVVWVNKDLFPHTATSAAGGFDSREIAAGQSWSFRPGKTGEFPYVCTFHPPMTAVLRVQ